MIGPDYYALFIVVPELAQYALVEKIMGEAGRYDGKWDAHYQGFLLIYNTTSRSRFKELAEKAKEAGLKTAISIAMC